MRYDKILLGATKDNELVFANFGISNRNEYPKFTASFDMVRPFDGDSIEMADDTGIDDAIDCSLYPETYTIDGIDWYFESMGCGQHDTRGEMAEYVNEDAYNVLHELWDKYHLKQADSVIAYTVEHIAHVLSLTNTEDWITDFIHRHIDELR